MTGRAQPYPRLAFLDSSANLAILDAKDTHHAQAAAIWRGLVSSRSRVLTTNYIVDESYTLIMSELGTPAALTFLRDIRRSAIVIERVSAADEERAEQILEQYQDHQFSYTDATSFAVMERFAITSAFGFDGDFRAYRLILLQP
jgi:predicted nucleic acid-binding protein